MCLNLFAYKSHPEYPLIIAANRDEFYRRATQPAHFWEDHPEILAGRDLVAGGTWIGINKKGDFAFITNYRDFSEVKEGPPSRGPLVSDFLKTESRPKAYLEQIENPKAYNGFNLLVGDLEEIFYLSNIKGEPQKVESGIHGVSNAFLDTPWMKVEKGKRNLENIISQDDFSSKDLLSMLKDEETAPDKKLPETGLPYEMEKAASAMFIKSPEYGTVCSTVLLIDNNGGVYFAEQMHNPTLEPVFSEFRFEIG